ncbi:MAG: hypothetical protein IMZ61_07135 [Planctomycetes bacterium]|nr:hypothetical protein [Planctomycetota bacterium]
MSNKNVSIKITVSPKADLVIRQIFESLNKVAEALFFLNQRQNLAKVSKEIFIENPYFHKTKKEKDHGHSFCN